MTRLHSAAPAHAAPAHASPAHASIAQVEAWRAPARRRSDLAPAPVAPDHMFTIAPASQEAFGELVKTWAKSPETAPLGVHDLESFAALLEAHGIEFTAPSRPGHELREIRVTQAELGVLELRIPAREMIEASERMLSESEYPLPSYCFDVFPGAEPEVDDNMELHRKRVADYVLLNCA